MIRTAPLIAICLLLPATAAETTLHAPSLTGTATLEGFLLEWQAPEADAILLTVTNEATQTVITLPGNASTHLLDGEPGDVYMVQYQQDGILSPSSNEVAWGPLDYPYCHPTNIITVTSDPPGVHFHEACVLPPPV